MGAVEKLKTINFPGTNKKLPLQIWDIPGAEKFRTLSSIYFRDADAAILVYDCTNKDSFNSLKVNWLREL
jgi:GTPase SAR1 family protein